MIKINLTSVMVDDQDKALKFYTEKLGFEPAAARVLEDTASLSRGAANILLRAAAEPRPTTVLIEAGVPATLAEEFTATGLTVGGGREDVSTGFEIRDPDGNILIFAKNA